MTARIRLCFLMLLFGQSALAIMERGDYPWNVKLRSYYDDEMSAELDTVPWLLNLGPTGIRARIYPDKANQLVVKYVFRDPKSPARDLIQAEDVIVGANGRKFKTSHRFGRNLPGGGGWDGPMMNRSIRTSTSTTSTAPRRPLSTSPTPSATRTSSTTPTSRTGMPSSSCMIRRKASAAGARAM
jgi:hypothetical protein